MIQASPNIASDRAPLAEQRRAQERLSAEDLAKSFRGRQVVKGVSLDVHAGEVVGLLGPNGAGKTTIFDMMVGCVSLIEVRSHSKERSLPTYRCTSVREEGSYISPRSLLSFDGYQWRTIFWQFWRCWGTREQNALSG